MIKNCLLHLTCTFWFTLLIGVTCMAGEWVQFSDINATALEFCAGKMWFYGARGTWDLELLSYDYAGTIETTVPDNPDYEFESNLLVTGSTLYAGAWRRNCSSLEPGCFVPWTPLVMQLYPEQLCIAEDYLLDGVLNGKLLLSSGSDIFTYENGSIDVFLANTPFYPVYEGINKCNFFIQDSSGAYIFSRTLISDIEECTGICAYKDGEYHRFLFDNDNGMSDLCYNDAVVRRDGSIFYAGENGIILDSGSCQLLYTDTDGRDYYRGIELTAGITDLNQYFTKLLQDSNGRIWAGSGDWAGSSEAIIIDSSNTVQVMKRFIPEQATGGITDIAEDSLGNIWVCGINMPVWVYNDNTVDLPISGVIRGHQSRAMPPQYRRPVPYVCYDLQGRRVRPAGKTRRGPAVMIRRDSRGNGTAAYRAFLAGTN